MTPQRNFLIDQPAHSDEVVINFPAEHVLVIVMNRQASLNAMTPQMETDIKNCLNWFDGEPSLWYVSTPY